MQTKEHKKHLLLLLNKITQCFNLSFNMYSWLICKFSFIDWTHSAIEQSMRAFYILWQSTPTTFPYCYRTQIFEASCTELQSEVQKAPYIIFQSNNFVQNKDKNFHFIKFLLSKLTNNADVLEIIATQQTLPCKVIKLYCMSTYVKIQSITNKPVLSLHPLYKKEDMLADPRQSLNSLAEP